MNKMAVIGAGMMGGAIVSGIVSKNVVPGEKIWISDPNTERMEELQNKLGIHSSASNIEAIHDADVVLLAVKPQFLDGVLEEINGHMDPNALLMTIVVGIPVSYYQKKLGHQRIVRIMPNTPAQVGQGACGWFASTEAQPEQKAFAASVLGALGFECEVKKEDVLDLITTVSGSGPAYVYLFIEAMIDAAVHMGLPRPMATQLTLQTVIGSAEYMKEKGTHPAILKNEVTSPGGTTAEALAVMERQGLRSAVADGMWACYRRTLELGKK